ncbi:hypothetical protein V6N13_025967 [Hibiscus sabdariffa]|uniref:Uncharacterized protein n=2 Tax=Hibiscus sabdariffa TaxID=183260 RepID=A0ABR2B8D0_9ROSI
MVSSYTLSLHIIERYIHKTRVITNSTFPFLWPTIENQIPFFSAGQPPWHPLFSSLYGIYLRRCFTTSGLTSISIHIDDDDTTVQSTYGPPNTPPPPKTRLAFAPRVRSQRYMAMASTSPVLHLVLRRLRCLFRRFHDEVQGKVRGFPSRFDGEVDGEASGKEVACHGTSYGGFVAYHMAKLWPDKVEKVLPETATQTGADAAGSLVRGVTLGAICESFKLTPLQHT